MKYIDADKLIAEIKRYKNKADERLKIKGRSYAEENKDSALQNLCGNLLYFISSIQQEPRFPQYDNIVEKIFGAGNLEGWEIRDAEMLVALAKEELLKSLQQEQPEVELEKAARNVYESWMGGTMDDVRRDMVELGKVLNARKEE